MLKLKISNFFSAIKSNFINKTIYILHTYIIVKLINFSLHSDSENNEYHYIIHFSYILH